jgi:hypothetical protein
VLSLVTGLAPGIGVVGLARWGGWQWWCAVVFAALDDGGYAGWANPATASAGLTWCVIAVTTFLVVDQNVRALLQQEERKGEMEREAGSTEVLCCHCFHCYALRVAMEIWSMDRMVCSYEQSSLGAMLIALCRIESYYECNTRFKETPTVGVPRRQLGLRPTRWVPAGYPLDGYLTDYES